MFLSQRCANCGVTGELHTHHIVPLALGGTNRPTNFCRLCTTCHGLLHGLDYSLHAATIAESRKRLREEGKWVVGPTPYGYITNRDGYIEEYREQSDVVRWIFHWRFDVHMTLQNISDILYELAIPTAKGRERWAISSIKELLEEPIYFGDVYKSATFPPIVDAKYKGMVESLSYRQHFPKIYISFSTHDVEVKEATQ